MLVVCNGMIRSGSTLQYNIVRLLLESTGSGRGEGFLTPPELARRWDELERWMAQDVMHVVKTHEFTERLVEPLASGRVRLCYTYRDIRDVAVSARAKFGLGPDRLLESLTRAVTTCDRIHTLPGAFTVRYEGMMRDLITAVGDHAMYLGLEVDDRALMRIAHECSPQAAQRRARAGVTPLRRVLVRMARGAGIPLQAYDETTLLHADHVSQTQGRPGVWRETLTPSEVEMLDRHFGEWLARHGYEPS